MASVTFEGIKKRYPNGFVAIHEASFTVPHGSFTVLVGPSGCGKSTLLRMVAGLERITTGAIRIDDQVVNNIPPKNRDIAMVFQDYALYPHMSVAKNMAYSLTLRGAPKAEIEERINTAAAMLNLQTMLERRPAQLSGGQRQRVAVGRAIVRNPKVFLFDEPLSNLDAKLRLQMRGELSLLHNRLGATMIYVTHDQVEAMTMADQIVVMKDGRILQIAPPLEIYARPADTYVAGFIGSPPMNFLPVSFDAKANRLAGEGFGIAPTDELVAPLRKSPAERVLLGVRPEDIHDRLTRPDIPAERTITAIAEIVEPMGAEVYVTAKVGLARIIARFRGDFVPEVGARLELALDLPRAHLFDVASEKRLVAA
jgi:multiple sugar transport system ATP-binding protein